MLILPADRVGIRFGSSNSPYEAVRMQPDINSSILPEPFKSRYQTLDGVRLPCNDVMIADSMACQDTIIYCQDPLAEFKFQVAGSGEIYYFNRRCSDFLTGFNWDTERELLKNSVNQFEQKWKDKVNKISQLTYLDSKGNEYSNPDDFQFEYTIDWNIRSNEPRCFQGDTFKYPVPKCSLQCKSK